jgi:AcrR family transcriptional regulator
VFAERGFHGATTQDIADVLGIRQASLYYYFPSKEGALELVCLQGVGGFFEAAKAIASGPAAPPTSSRA